MTTQTLTITPKVDTAKLALYQAGSTQELLALSPLIISDPETAEVIAKELQTELGRIDEMNAMKKEAAGPLAQLKKTIDGWFKPGLDSAQTLVTMYKTALAKWSQIQSAEREALLLTAGEAARTGDVAALTEALTEVNRPTSKPEGISYIERWTFRVCNPEMLPREFLMPDEKALARYVSQANGRPEYVPGVTFEKETSVRSSHG